jgi:DNA-binding XRE family transcriptional regulator
LSIVAPCSDRAGAGSNGVFQETACCPVFPSLSVIARHHDRMAAYDQFAELLRQLREAREQRGLSLAELTELTGMDRSALSKLESGQRPNPTLETLIRYAEAVGKRLVVSLVDASP